MGIVPDPWWPRDCGASVSGRACPRAPYAGGHPSFACLAKWAVSDLSPWACGLLPMTGHGLAGPRRRSTGRSLLLAPLLPLSRLPSASAPRRSPCSFPPSWRLPPCFRRSPGSALSMRSLPPYVFAADLRLLLLPQAPRSRAADRRGPRGRIRASPDRAIPPLRPLDRHPPRGTARPPCDPPPGPRPGGLATARRARRRRSLRELRVQPGLSLRHRHGRRGPVLVPLRARPRAA